MADFLNGLSVPVWITESARQGVNQQLAYAETAWPFLRESVGRIERIYWFQFTSREAAGSTFGLKTPDPGAPVSDLYVWLRDHK